jgi:SNF2 family DNA or RNA helicase
LINQQHWDLIILDEARGIKSWEVKTSQTIKALRSRFALVLSGTPLENRLDDLYSIVEFVDDRRLGPGFDFYNRHRVLDEKGKITGYQNLSQLREKLPPILLRRTRAPCSSNFPSAALKLFAWNPPQPKSTCTMASVPRLTA